VYIYIYIYRILDLENEVHSIWVIWTSNFQECKGRGRPESGRARVGHARVGVGQGRDMLGLGDRGSYTKVIGGQRKKISSSLSDRIGPPNYVHY
jgi:hypothetical protein